MHSSPLDKTKEYKEIKIKYESQNKKVGLRCMRFCYTGCLKARLYTDYEDQVAVNVQGDIDMGNINHSRKCASKFLPCVANIIQNKVKTFLSTPMIQT